jgi:hypothetical protein
MQGLVGPKGHAPRQSGPSGGTERESCRHGTVADMGVEVIRPLRERQRASTETGVHAAGIENDSARIARFGVTVPRSVTRAREHHDACLFITARRSPRERRMIHEAEIDDEIEIIGEDTKVVPLLVSRGAAHGCRRAAPEVGPAEQRPEWHAVRSDQVHRRRSPGVGAEPPADGSLDDVTFVDASSSHRRRERDSETAPSAANTIGSSALSGGAPGADGRAASSSNHCAADRAPRATASSPS